MSLENLEDELIKTNPEEMLSTNELIDSIQLYDATVEIIGFVDGIDSPKIVGSNQQFKIFKFYISNGMGRRIIHLDGVQARVPKIAAFNNGNVPFELLIRSNSIITNLGKYEPTTNFIENPITIKFTEIFNTTQRISLDGYIKTNFAEIHDPKLNKKIGCGAITDGMYKLEVHILEFSKIEYIKLNINKGNKIQNWINSSSGKKIIFIKLYYKIIKIATKTEIVFIFAVHRTS
ncbi:hypothetical protein PUN28_003776 [Cardiocondyla obscurior]|uniref:Uncharacterized protein n=1 Tax=Cardiocondyla obscurior TaxID=286306 RepID=A0AAW2GKR8_9HYME